MVHDSANRREERKEKGRERKRARVALDLGQKQGKSQRGGGRCRRRERFITHSFPSLNTSPPVHLQEKQERGRDGMGWEETYRARQRDGRRKMEG